jgi:hypothetical protein
MCPYLYHYHPAPAAPEATSDTCQPQPAQTKLTIVKQLPVPWEDVWVSSSDGTWTFDKVVERKELDDDHFQTATHGIMTRKSEGWLWDYFDVRTTKNDRVYQPAPAALETPAMCPKCSSTDLDERGNCYACLASASEPAPQPAEVTTENLDRLENILTISRWGRQPDDISSFAVTPTGCFVGRDAAILACGRDVNANVTRETEALRKTVEELERAALDFGATAAEFRLSDGTIKPKCPRPAYGDHFLGQLRNQCALCSQVAVLVETRTAPILAERDEARAQRDSLQAAATRLEAQRVDLERKLVETLERLEEEKKCRDDLMEGLAEARAAQRPRVELTASCDKLAREA